MREASICGIPSKRQIHRELQLISPSFLAMKTVKLFSYGGHDKREASENFLNCYWLFKRKFRNL